MWGFQKYFFCLVKTIAAAAAATWYSSKKVYVFWKTNFKHLKIFRNVSKVVSEWKISYILRIKKKFKVFGKKVVKNGCKVKKDIFSTQDILLALFGRGGGLQPFWSHKTLKSLPTTPSEKIPPASLWWTKHPQFFLGLKVNRRRRRRRSKFLPLKKKRFFQRGFKSTKNHTRGVKFLFVM